MSTAESATSRPEQSVLDAIAELEALENPDRIDTLVCDQLKAGVERGEIVARGTPFQSLTQRERAKEMQLKLYTRRCRGCSSPDPHDSHLTDAGRRWLGLELARRAEADQ